jgi:hypothetical protein
MSIRTESTTFDGDFSATKVGYEQPAGPIGW